jgi:sugar/nucleoside kinase (ribokinase family)
MTTVAVVGSLSLDTVAGAAPRVGGCPFYAARALRAIGAPAVIVAKCAAPDRQLLLLPLIRLGIPVVWQDSTRSAAFSFSYEQERRQMTVEAIADPWTPAEVIGGVGRTRWVHVAPLTRADFPAETLVALARSSRVSLDGQGLVRQARVGPLELDADYDPEVLRPVSILKLSDEEADLLVDGYDERALARLGVREVVVTLGSRGCIVYADGVAEFVRAHAVPSTDPTGAGDTFATAYLAARSTGAAPAAAARRAASLVADTLAGRAA